VQFLVGRAHVESQPRGEIGPGTADQALGVLRLLPRKSDAVRARGREHGELAQFMCVGL
jgi:hypothetical protein